MRGLTLSLCAIVAIAATTAPPSIDPPRAQRVDGRTPSGSFVVRCGTLYTGDGPARHDVALVVRDGRVTEIVEAWQPALAELPVLDARDKVVMPGIVAADSYLTGQRDNDYSVTPDFVAIDGFDFDRDFSIELSGGVTSVYLGVGRNRLMPGQGSVVKLAGDDLVQRTLAENCALHITLGEASTDSPWIFEPTISPTSDDPLTPATRQYPSARVSQLATLRSLFDSTALADADFVSSRMVENRYDAEPLRRALAGGLPLRILAHEPADVLRGVQFAKRSGMRAILDDPYDLAPIAERLAAADVGVVLRVPVAVSASNPGGEDRRDESPRARLGNAGIAERAGVRFALALSEGADLGDYLFSAGIAIRHGLSIDGALRAITSDAARVLGVADRVGTLAPGKDADFLVLSGEPFSVGTMVEQTFVDGVPAFEREVRRETLAIRAGRVFTLEGDNMLRDATILISDGKIKAIGEGLAIPYGARILDLPEGTVTPGFIDTFTSAGLAGDGTGVPNGTADQRIADVVRHDDATFVAAREAGLTTLLVAGPDGRTVSGRVAAIKTGAADDASAVLRAIAGLRIVHDEIGPDAIKPVRDLIERGKKYIDSWENYSKKRAEWEAEQAKAKAEGAAPAAEEATVEADPLSGRWECSLTGLPIPIEITVVLELKLSGKKVTGTWKLQIGGNDGPPPSPIENGAFEDGELTFDVAMMGESGKVVATITEDSLEGRIEGGPQEVGLRGKRVSKDTKKAAVDKGPQEPTIDEALEPVRAIIEKKIPAIVRVDRAPAVRDVIEFFQTAGLPFVLQGVDDAVTTPSILGETPPAVILGPELVERDKGVMVNAAARLADRSVQLAFATGDTLGCRYLPLHVAHAIRWGLDPQTALRALTIDAARMFKLEDRVGSLARGKDADLVVFSGNPFELTSRVVLVVCNGRVVFDARQTGVTEQW